MKLAATKSAGGEKGARKDAKAAEKGAKQGDKAAGFPVVEPAAVGVNPETIAAVDTLIKDGIEAGRFAGASIGMARAGKVFHWRHHGWDDVKLKTKLHDDSIFRIMSMTKLVTTTAIMMLVESGKLGLEDALSKYIPSFAQATVYTGKGKPAAKLVRPITIRHMLTHTSGLFYPFENLTAGLPDDLRKKFMKNIEKWNKSERWYDVPATDVPLLHQPGTKFSYGVSFDVLARVVTVVSGVPYGQFVEERICTPLKMKDTSFFVPPAKQGRLACHYEKGVVYGFSKVTTPVPFWPCRPWKHGGHCEGGGGLFSTLGDCLRFAMMLANGGELNGVRVLKESTVAKMYADQMPCKLNWGEYVHFGFGGQCVPAWGNMWGWDGAWSTHLQVCFRRRIAYVVMRQLHPIDSSLHQKIDKVMGQAQAKMKD